MNYTHTIVVPTVIRQSIVQVAEFRTILFHGTMAQHLQVVAWRVIHTRSIIKEMYS
jgi:hypothetical protein